MRKKWVKFWKGVYIFAFGIRTFLIGNLIFDIWPATMYQLSAMHFGKDSPRRGRAILSLFYCYLCAIVTIFELFLMFHVSHRISILNEQKEEEILQRVKTRQKEIEMEEDEKKLQVKDERVADVPVDVNAIEMMNFNEGIEEKKNPVVIPSLKNMMSKNKIEKKNLDELEKTGKKSEETGDKDKDKENDPNTKSNFF